MKKSIKLIVAISATALVSSVAVTPAAHGATKQKVCVALDTAGINDKSFNQSSYEGAKMALSKGYAASIKYAPAKSNADYAPNIKGFIAEKCTVIVGIGLSNVTSSPVDEDVLRLPIKESPLLFIPV